jgi:transposase
VRAHRIGAGYQHRTVPTTTGGLLDLAAWLTEAQCTHVAMAATGLYWKPVWHLLEDQVTLILANAMHVRHVPGRKSDMTDAAWIADLLAHGLIRSSFVPPAPMQELRDLTRTRKQLVGEIARHTLRIQKTLEDANVKLTHVGLVPQGEARFGGSPRLRRGQAPSYAASLRESHH